ncbi:hypothetical protein E5Q_02818 [Mixia osmundae IAM 14324]|uniref:Acyl carrier protein n=1 Tax=Mixia osmundae (strain CBS 9802 / IAM 14324 / JCM 22182 / KY 12970) TaxID=764103 RepID=G7DZZ7_MIXOS|nr:hypothetical protein E5Q_02818 [Mixia osmundae IAM 14324]
MLRSVRPISNGLRACGQTAARSMLTQAKPTASVNASRAMSYRVSAPARWTVPARLGVRYASSGGLDKSAITERVLDVLKSFEKVDPTKLTASSSFTTDLGLDSLDAVEVVMAVEEEFSIEIPDEEADRITSIAEAIDYIANTPEAH